MHIYTYTNIYKHICIYTHIQIYIYIYILTDYYPFMDKLPLTSTNTPEVNVMSNLASSPNCFFFFNNAFLSEKNDIWFIEVGWTELIKKVNGKKQIDLVHP